jgi:hypothetical protein
MTHNVNTAMREAFLNANVKCSDVKGETVSLVLSSLKRKVGVTKRNAMWSVQRGRKRV